MIVVVVVMCYKWDVSLSPALVNTGLFHCTVLDKNIYINSSVAC